MHFKCFFLIKQFLFIFQKTALDIAVQKDDIKTVELLLKHKDIDTKLRNEISYFIYKIFVN